MRHLLLVCALAFSASAAVGQQPDTVTRQPGLYEPRAADTLELALRPDCLRPSVDSAQTDSLCLTRQQVIAEALAHNPQLQVSAEQVAQARARKVQATA